MTHEESIASIGNGRRVIIGRTCPVHLAEDGNSAAIIDVIDEPRVAGLDRSQQDEGALERNAAAGIARRRLQIDYALVRCGIRIETEFGDAPDLLVRAGITEIHARGKGRALENFDSSHLSPCGNERRESHRCQSQQHTSGQEFHSGSLIDPASTKNRLQFFVLLRTFARVPVGAFFFDLD
jgi:hypothetical protein